MQIQGRGAQLGISFGVPKAPDCRGITPEELERINFKTLDLSSMVDELMSKKVLPDGAIIEQSNTNHVDALHDKGAPHD